MGIAEQSSQKSAKTYDAISSWQFAEGRSLMNLLGIEKGHRVLDIGSGTGGLTRIIGELVGDDGKVIGVDPDPERVRFATARKNHPSVCYKEARIEECDSLPRGHFDFAYSNYVLHWLTDDQKLAGLDHVRRSMKPGAKIGINTSAAIPDLVQMLTRAIPGRNKTLESLHCMEAGGWEQMMLQAGFKEIEIETHFNVIPFANLMGFMDWIEGTSHGAFSAEQMRPEYRSFFKELLPSEIDVVHRNIRIFGRV